MDDVHFNDAFTHLQRPLQPFSLYQPQWISLWHTSEASGNDTNQKALSSWPLTDPSCNLLGTVRFSRAAWGYLTPMVYFQAAGLFLRSYGSNSNLSIETEWLIISSNFRSSDILGNEVVSSPKWFHVFHAAFFPLPVKNKTWSHPLNVWKSVRHFHFSRPRSTVILCISRHLKCFPVWIANQSPNKCSCPNKLTDIATTSVSSVRISTFFMPVGWHPLHVRTSLCQLLPNLKVQ